MINQVGRPSRSLVTTSQFHVVQVDEQERQAGLVVQCPLGAEKPVLHFLGRTAYIGTRTDQTHTPPVAFQKWSAARWLNSRNHKITQYVDVKREQQTNKRLRCLSKVDLLLLCLSEVDLLLI